MAENHNLGTYQLDCGVSLLERSFSSNFNGEVNSSNLGTKKSIRVTFTKMTICVISNICDSPME